MKIVPFNIHQNNAFFIQFLLYSDILYIFRIRKKMFFLLSSWVCSIAIKLNQYIQVSYIDRLYTCILFAQLCDMYNLAAFCDVFHLVYLLRHLNIISTIHIGRIRNYGEEIFTLLINIYLVEVFFVTIKSSFPSHDNYFAF